MKYQLNENEQASLEAFLAKRTSTKILKNGGQVALIFSHGSGIGITITAKIRDNDVNEAEADVTDYGAW